jgi:hypothetical protein
MGDMDDDFRAMHKANQEKRESNRGASARMLTAAGITFVTKNDGAHLIVAERYDFWPGTGLWMARGDKTKRRGVVNLIKRIKAKP